VSRSKRGGAASSQFPGETLPSASELALLVPEPALSLAEGVAKPHLVEGAAQRRFAVCSQ